ncbi:MAG: O-antigen ligase family protein, partial [Candidatus Hydrogenedentes bacterium]|nr:O-antigen ligase family protein [Candidatus Hydrogenedentota bacterium]
MTFDTEDTGFPRIVRGVFAAAAFLVVLSLCPFTGDPAVHVKILLYSVTGGLLAAVYAVRQWRLRGPARRGLVFLLPLLVFLALFTAAALASDHCGNALAETSKFVALFLVYWAASRAYGEPAHVHCLMAVVCGAVAVSVLYGFVQRAGFDPFPWETAGLDRPFAEMPGTFGNGNIAAHATILCIIMAVYLAIASRRLRWCLLLVPLYLLHLCFSHQRGGIVALLAAGALLALVMLAHRRGFRPWRAIAAGFLGLVVMALLAGGGFMALKAARTGLPYPTDPAILLRMHGYSGAAGMIGERPLLGWGPGNYRLENPRFWTAFEQEHYAVERKLNHNVHNDALEIGVDAGLAAAGLYLTLLILAVIRGLAAGLTERAPARRRLGFAFAALFCAFLVDGLFGFNLRAPVTATLLFLLLGALEGVYTPAAPAAPAPGTRAWPAWAHHLAAGSLLLAGVAAAAFQTRVFASELLLQRGKGALHWEAYLAAEQALARGERLIPWNAEFAYQRGLVALESGAPLDAAAFFERALERTPTFIPASIGAAQALIAAVAHEPASNGGTPGAPVELLERATRHAREALELCAVLPDGEEALGRIALVRVSLDSAPGEQDAAWQDARQHFERALACRAANTAELYHLLAVVCTGSGDYAEAEDAIVRAINAEPRRVTFWGAFWRLTERTGRDALFRSMLIARVPAAESPETWAAAPELQAVRLACDATPDGAGLAEAARALAQAATSKDSLATATVLERDLGWAADLIRAAAQAAPLGPEERAEAVYLLGSV